MNAKFEKHAREQLAEHEVAVDTDALWANVHPHVQPQNGHRKTVWVFLLGLMLGLTAFGVFYLNNDSATDLTESNTTVKPSNNSNDVKAATAIVSEQSIEKEIVSSLETEKETTSNSTNILSTENNPKLVSTSNNKTTKEASKSQKDLAMNSNAKSNQKFYSNLNTSTKNVATSSAPQVQINAPTVIDDQVIVSNPDLLKTNDAGIKNLNKDSKIIVYQAANQLPTLFPEFLNSEKELPANFLNGYKFLPGNFASTNQKKKRKGAFFRDLKFGLGLYTGVSSSAADLEAMDESATEYLLLRTNSEKQLESLHFGFNAIIETDQSIYLRTGAEYTRIASLFSRSSQQVVTDSVPGIVEIQIELNGDSTFIEGQVLRTTTTSFIKKSYNYFHQVDVPIIFGYNFGSADDSWRIGVEAGVYANVLLKRKGEVSLADGEFYDIKEDKNEWYKNNIGISPYLGINMAYNLNENIQVHLNRREICYKTNYLC